MAPVTVDVAPEVIASVADTLRDNRIRVSDAVRRHGEVAWTWASMAGSDAAGTEWGRSYDSDAADLLTAVAGVTAALGTSAVLVRQVAANYAAAEERAGGPPASVGPAVVEPVPPVTTLPSAVGDAGPGLQGAIELADAVGVPCPNGDTDQLRAAARCWTDLGASLAGAADGIRDASRRLTAEVTAPEVEPVRRDVGRVATACTAAAAGCAALADSCDDYADRLAHTRERIRDLIERFALEEAATVTLGIGLAFVSAGLSAAAAMAVSAGRFAATANRVRALLETLRAFAAVRRSSPTVSQARRAADGVEDVARREPIRADAPGPGSVPEGKPGFANTRALDDHFARHGRDVGARSAQEYAELAAKFRAEGTHPTKVGADGTVRMYDPASNTFASYTPDGTIKTFFKPSSGAAYWDRQPGGLIQ